MPTLKQITTSIELGPSDTHIREYDHRFTDGSVECFIVAPETNIPFHVRITTSGYIAPGLAAYVFIDGEYQCNRNRLCLEVPGDGVDPAEYEIDFKLRQKEEKTSDGYFVARDWYFTPLKTGVADGEPNMSRDWAKNVGTIEVVILRCKQGGEKETATDPAETVVATAPSAGRDMLRALGAKSKPPKQSAENAWNAYKEDKSKGGNGIKAKGGNDNTAKTPSKAPSKKGSVAGSFGGMYGLFDGAGDDPGYYRQFRPKNVVGQTFRPGHRYDDSTGRYGYYEDDDPFIRNDSHRRDDRSHTRHTSESRYQPNTYTVAGGFDDHEQTPSTRFGPKRVVPRTSPSPVVDQSKRRRGVEFEIPTRSSSDRHSDRHTTRRQQSREEPEERRPHRRGISVYIEDVSNRMSLIQHTAMAEADKYEALWDETNDDVKSDLVYNNMLTMLKLKHEEIQKMLAELQKLNDDVKAFMDDMDDRMEWKQTYDMLFERGLLPPPKIDLSPPERPIEGKDGEEKKDDDKKEDDDWLQVGGGATDDKAGETGKSGSETNKDEHKAASATHRSGTNSNKPETDWGKSAVGAKADIAAGGWSEPKEDKGSDPNDTWTKKASDKPKSSHSRTASRPIDGSSDGSDAQPQAEMKSYWKDWSKKPADAPKLKIPFRDPYKYPAPPTRPTPANRAKDINHGVQTGRGADYAHKHFRPDYLDTMEKPYAVFTLKYRSKKALEKVLKKKLEEGYVEVAVKGAEMERLMRTPKDELVAELMRKRGVPEKSRAGSSRVSAAEEIKAASEEAKSKVASVKGYNANWDNSPGAGGAAADAPAGDGGWPVPTKGSVKDAWETGSVKPHESVSQVGSNKTHSHFDKADLKMTKPTKPKGSAGGGGAKLPAGAKW